MNEIYRDGTEGASAKRQELLRKRRDELVTMPHAVRRVIVARSARIAAGAAVVFAGAAFLVAALSPSLTTWLAHAVPGMQLSVLTTLATVTWILGFGVYLIARARIEHRFAVAMSRYVLPGDDLAHDIERLDHEHPDEMAKQMAHRLEVRSAALPVLAAAMLVPAAALLAIQVMRTRGWPVLSEFEASLARHGTALAAIAMAGLVGAIAMTRRAPRLPVVAHLGGALGVFAGALALATALQAPGDAAWWFLGIAVIAGTIGLMARRLRIERGLIAADDPAAGSELFTVRGFVRRARASFATLTVANARQVIRRPRAIAAVVALGGGVVGLAMFGHTARAKPLAVHATSVAAVTNPPGTDAEPAYHVERAANGSLRVDVMLVGALPLDIPSLAELDTLPTNWRARVTVELTASTASVPIVATPFASDPAVVPAPLAMLVSHVFTSEVCDGPAEPIGLRLVANQPATQATRVTLTVTPELSVARCDGR